MKKAISLAVVGLFLAQGLLFLRQPAEKIWMDENRAVAAFPASMALTHQGVKAFFASIDSFLADRAFLRQGIIDTMNALPNNKVFDFDHALAGRDGWLFLGNTENNCVSKLTGTANPVIRGSSLQNANTIFGQIQRNGLSNAFLLVGPNKSTIYPEYLPKFVKPAKERYALPYINALVNAGVKVFDPTQTLLAAKSDDYKLYYRRDSHWNLLGGALAYRAFMEYLKPFYPNIAICDVELEKTAPFRTDLERSANAGEEGQGISDDSFKIKRVGPPHDLTVVRADGTREMVAADFTSFIPQDGQPVTVINEKATSPYTLWLFGDSFTEALTPYLFATFRVTTHFSATPFYAGTFPKEGRPDIIVLERVERTF